MDDRERNTESLLDRERAAGYCINSALQYIDQHYGTGEGDGENPKAYHNLVHTWDVLGAAEKIALAAIEKGKIAASDMAFMTMSKILARELTKPRVLKWQ